MRKNYLAGLLLIIAADAFGQEMTNRRARAICTEVTKAINDGSIRARLLEFGAPAPDAQKRWSEAHPGDPRTLSATLTLDHRGRTRTLGRIAGEGSCPSCSVVDVRSRQETLYPSDDKEERFRWAGWGACGHVLMVDGEPIEVTGNFHGDRAQVSLLAWIAPDGAKRALCFLGSTGEVKATISGAADPALCHAVAEGRVDALPWNDSYSISNDAPQASPWDEAGAVALDMDGDGKKDVIGRFQHSSGAGCGSTREWLEVLEAREEAPAVEYGREKEPATYYVAQTPLGRALRQHGARRVEDGERENSLFGLKLFVFRGKPYLLGSADSSRPAVMSFWGGKTRRWCELKPLPQYRVERFYPIETWPPRAAAAR